MLSLFPAILQLYEVVFSHRSSLIKNDKPIFPITQLPSLDQLCEFHHWVPYNLQSETDKIQRLSQARSTACGETL
jgi:hypothetical protein